MWKDRVREEAPKKRIRRKELRKTTEDRKLWKENASKTKHTEPQVLNKVS